MSIIIAPKTETSPEDQQPCAHAFPTLESMFGMQNAHQKTLYHSLIWVKVGVSLI